jgi:hypothetical protein
MDGYHKKGAGWVLVDPKLCDSTRRRQIAKKYCLEGDFRDQFSYRLESHMGEVPSRSV